MKAGGVCVLRMQPVRPCALSLRVCVYLLCPAEAGALKLLLTFLPKLKLVCAAVEEVNLQGVGNGRWAHPHTTPLHITPYSQCSLLTCKDSVFMYCCLVMVTLLGNLSDNGLSPSLPLLL